ncbi:hypothetical protein NW764_015650 [Fusarium oxysporum]|nr:hypothetical protein NW764_015650 [Fusarium oxysporum]
MAKTTIFTTSTVTNFCLSTTTMTTTVSAPPDVFLWTVTTTANLTSLVTETVTVISSNFGDDDEPTPTHSESSDRPVAFADYYGNIYDR